MLIPAMPSPRLIRWFHRYTRRYLQHGFHAIHLSGAIEDRLQDPIPLLICMNHTSWWDVMLGIYLSGAYFQRECYGVMDAAQLRRYRFFARLGMIGVDRSNLRGAREFLNYATTLLSAPKRALWLTPQGEMVSNHLRPIHFQPGLGHLVASFEEVLLITIAVHYEFWEERLPEAFLSVSPPLLVQTSSPDFDRRELLRSQELRLTDQLDLLLTQVRNRERGAFQTILQGRTGVSATYDLLRRTTAKLRGEKFNAAHGEVETPVWRRR